MAQAFEDLLVWQRSIELSLAVYAFTKDFPREEIYGLTSQLRRAAVSIASNIAEGRGRLTDGEFRQFLGTAQGSTYEVQTQLVIARKLGLGHPDKGKAVDQISREVSKMLAAFIASLQTKGKS